VDGFIENAGYQTFFVFYGDCMSCCIDGGLIGTIKEKELYAGLYAGSIDFLDIFTPLLFEFGVLCVFGCNDQTE
jgi:hypothetical protein